MMHLKINHVILAIDGDAVHQQNQPLPLSAKGHRCFKLFLESPNITLSKDHLIACLWPNMVVSDDSLFKVIQEVRNALQQIGLEKGDLHNVYGQGYQLVAQVQTFKPSRQRLVWVLVAVALVATLASFYWWPGKPPQISDAQFLQLVATIEQQPRRDGLDWQQLDHWSHGAKADALKVAYLQAFKEYKTGQYDASISRLQQAIADHGLSPASRALADSHLLLSQMFVYRQDKQLLQNYLTTAKALYQAIDYPPGLVATTIAQARYEQSIFQFEQSVKTLHQAIQQAASQNDKEQLLWAQANLAYAYQEMGRSDLSFQAMNDTLDMALEQSNPRYAALAYGQLSEYHWQQADPNKAMNMAQQALHFALTQQDTNAFQQGFSHYYTLLYDLGHLAMAEQYLQQAIDIQAKFNDESLLVIAELDLARVKTAVGDPAASLDIVQKLSASPLTQSETNQIQVITAQNHGLMGDNITAFTMAKLVLDHADMSDHDVFKARLVLAEAAWQLERMDVLHTMMEIWQASPPPPAADVYPLYLDLAGRYYRHFDDEPATWQTLEKQRIQHHLDRQAMQQATLTPPELQAKLDQYINTLLSN